MFEKLNILLKKNNCFRCSQMRKYTVDNCAVDYGQLIIQTIQ